MTYQNVQCHIFCKNNILAVFRYSNFVLKYVEILAFHIEYIRFDTILKIFPEGSDPPFQNQVTPC